MGEESLNPTSSRLDLSSTDPWTVGLARSAGPAHTWIHKWNAAELSELRHDALHAGWQFLIVSGEASRLSTPSDLPAALKVESDGPKTLRELASEGHRRWQELKEAGRQDAVPIQPVLVAVGPGYPVNDPFLATLARLGRFVRIHLAVSVELHPAAGSTSPRRWELSHNIGGTWGQYAVSVDVRSSTAYVTIRRHSTPVRGIDAGAGVRLDLDERGNMVGVALLRADADLSSFRAKYGTFRAPIYLAEHTLRCLAATARH